MKSVLITIVAIILVIAIADTISVCWKSSPSNIITYDTDNQYITSSTLISAHRSGGGIMPEESMMAFTNCIENEDFNVDIFEFDLHITKDNVLVLLHDDTLDRTTNSDTIFGVEDAKPEDYTYDELRRLNIGAKFEDEDGNMPYADYTEEDTPDELKIVRIEDILDYLMSNGDFYYIIEIKNGGDLGKQGVDILYEILEERNLLDSVIFGTFKEEVSLYVDDTYPNLKRSATIKEVLKFWWYSLIDKDDLDVNYVALQIPYNLPWRLAFNLGTAKTINYAHKNNIAVQYWTVNSESDTEYLASIGADCVMSDYPDKMYSAVYGDSTETTDSESE